MQARPSLCVAPDPDPGPRATGATRVWRPRPRRWRAVRGDGGGWGACNAKPGSPCPGEAPPRGVMRCHVLSCSGALRCLRPPRRSFVRPCPACRFSIAFRPTLFRSSRRRPPGRAGPFSARIVCARAPPVGAGAVRAPDCAREAQGALVPCVSSGFFSRRRETGEGAAPPDAASFLLPYSSMDFSQVKPCFRNYFKKAGRRSHPGSAGARRFVLRTARL